MALRKDDPVYYKKKISDLIKQAKDEGLEVELESGGSIYLSFTSQFTKERASVDLGKKFKKGNC